jgi:hypothetical protein
MPQLTKGSKAIHTSRQHHFEVWLMITEGTRNLLSNYEKKQLRQNLFILLYNATYWKNHFNELK